MRRISELVLAFSLSVIFALPALTAPGGYGPVLYYSDGMKVLKNKLYLSDGKLTLSFGTTASGGNVAIGESAASASTSYPLLIERTLANLVAVQISNPSSDAAASAKIQLSTDAGDKKGELAVFPNEAVTAAYSSAFVVRPTENSTRLSLIGGDLAAGYITSYTGGDYTTAGEVLRINADKSLQLMQQISTPATPASGSGKLYLKSDDNLYYLDDNGTEGRLKPSGLLLSGPGLFNCSVTASVATNALTVALKNAAGSDASSASPCSIAYRSATATSGVVAAVDTTSSLTVVVSNGSSLGCTASAVCTVFVYAINSGSGNVLGVIGESALDEGNVASSTAEGGAGAADTLGTLYSTAAQTDKPIRLLARLTVTPGGSHAWDAAPTVIANVPFAAPAVRRGKVVLDSPNGHGSTNTKIRRYTNSTSVGTAITYADSAGNGASLTINADGVYAMSGVDRVSTSGCQIGASVNSAELTTNIASVAVAGRACGVGYSEVSGTLFQGFSCTTRLKAGDIVRPHGNGACDTTGFAGAFQIERIGD